MTLPEAVEVVQKLAEALPDLFGDVGVHMAFGHGRPNIGDWSDPTNLGMLTTGDGVGGQSGVYFFVSPNGEILYIGKATKDNLHQRVWDHVRTPVVLESGRRTFPDHRFRDGMDVHGHESDVRNGLVYVGVIAISEPELASLVEVYLHTLHRKRHQRLPLFNKQIG